MSTTTSINTSIDQVVANVRAIGLPPDRNHSTNLLVSKIYRELAKGSPVDPTTIDALIEESRMDLEPGREFVAGVSEPDDAGNVGGAVGLSQKQYADQFRVNGVDLTTWCAWDTLFIAQILARTPVSLPSPPALAMRSTSMSPHPVRSRHPRKPSCRSFCLIPSR